MQMTSITSLQLVQFVRLRFAEISRKIVADEKYGEILGVHMIGAGVTENIHEAVAAMGLEGTVADLVHAIHAHPTLAEGMHEALESVFGAAINTFQSAGST